jgi:colicin import membrane protein
VKESRADNRAALLQALGLHVVLFALMFAGLHWTRSTIAEAAHGEVIEADLVSVSDLSASMQRALQRDAEPLPQPIVEPEPLPPEPEASLPETVPEPPVEELPPPEPDPAPVEQERVQRDADSAQVAKVDREQEEKRTKPEQAELDAQRRRMEALAEIRRQRALAAQERTMAEQRAQQLNDARTSTSSSATPTRPPPGNPDSRSAENAKYQVALMNAILRQWTRPESVALGQVCQVLIRQIPGGEVVSVEISPNCPYDEQGRRSVEAAILKASPLPYAGFEDVFVRNPVLKFRAEDL